MSSYTKGEWTFAISPDGQRASLLTPEGAVILDLAVGANTWTAEDFEANVQLLVAAPMLLEALRRILDQTDHEQWVLGNIKHRRVRAAGGARAVDRAYAEEAIRRALYRREPYAGPE